MKYIKAWSLFESHFYSGVDKEFIVKWLQLKLDFITGRSGQDSNLAKLIYHFIIRASGKMNNDGALAHYLKTAKPTFAKIINNYLNYSNSSIRNPLVKFYPNPDLGNMQWLEAKFNRDNKVKGSDNTYNYYVTFSQTADNLRKFFNSVGQLITKFTNWSQGNPEFVCGFKFGSDVDYYATEKDHLKFYYYDRRNRAELVKLVDEWLSENNIVIDKRPYDHAIDGKGDDGKKTSFGDIAATKIAKVLEDFMIKHRDKFTADQYFDWLLKFMSEVKWNITEK